MTISASPVNSSTVPIGNTAALSSGSSTGSASLLDPNTFLSLLVAELRYQDPMDPTNSANFMSQLAQLSQVQQLQTMTLSSRIGAAASLIGRPVTGIAANGSMLSGTVTGVTNGSTGPMLNVGGNLMDLSNVTQIGTV
ncbi:MAG TPA: flagellar hook capping FlgD N-terminal domain-containing protein [Candidatus Paceibacterota bacterium]|nr:flagellar hook capping FlgD N-terminal domain-containing protein [Candidatus Paceibacterota bacterium]